MLWESKQLKVKKELRIDVSIICSNKNFCLNFCFISETNSLTGNKKQRTTKITERHILSKNKHTYWLPTVRVKRKLKIYHYICEYRGTFSRILSAREIKWVATSYPKHYFENVNYILVRKFTGKRKHKKRLEKKQNCKQLQKSKPMELYNII